MDWYFARQPDAFIGSAIDGKGDIHWGVQSEVAMRSDDVAVPLIFLFIVVKMSFVGGEIQHAEQAIAYRQAITPSKLVETIK